MTNSKALLEKLERGEDLTLDEAKFFAIELYRAIREGRIMAGDRPLRMFRVVKEVNDEMMPIMRSWKGWKTRRANASRRQVNA